MLTITDDGYLDVKVIDTIGDTEVTKRIDVCDVYYRMLDACKDTDGSYEDFNTRRRLFLQDVGFGNLSVAAVQKIVAHLEQYIDSLKKKESSNVSAGTVSFSDSQLSISAPSATHQG